MNISTPAPFGEGASILKRVIFPAPCSAAKATTLHPTQVSSAETLSPCFGKNSPKCTDILRALGR